jgi:outer membrane protein assembly factor BamB
MKKLTGPILGRRAALMMTAGFVPLALAGCGDDKKVNIIGKQVPVLPVNAPLVPAVDAPPVSVPAAVTLQDWPQYMGNTSHAPGNVAGPASMTHAWRSGIGEGGGYRQPLQASPILAAGKVFTMDANGNVSAYSASSGAQIWRTYTRPKHATVLNIGGGIGYNTGVLYASTGYSEILAIDPASGKINWRQPLDFPARSAPTIGAGLVAVICQNDLLLTFDANSGAPGWRFLGQITPATASVAVIGAPAIAAGIVVAGFSSGTLAALDANSGTPVWEQSFAGSYGGAGTVSFVDVAAAPIIANGVVYAIGLGGSMQAIDLRSGAKVWERSAAGNQPVYAAGDFIFVLDNGQKLAAIHADDGLVTWSVQMPNFKNMKKKKNPITWAGPMMLNGLLVLTSDHGEVAMIDPADGSIKSTAKIDGPADLPPIAAGGMLLQLTRNATLTAYS